ncbi:DUF2125 domain-containing protein [Pseudohalocynthiibacter aestuariivivens]|jgi:Uncharacterized protein conserved in bacteria (DUF2125)|uniref:DUF2125 domain-containing protein n=1 Tax=Pseudohalocynthiibacter aestuariivivens TaxID=1591409 RepID=A0ABV5JDS1_9RHOB|nr:MULTISPECIES: DUF2125 domain-containing protein [Pseudohalocynthiibacter]MBS9718025.1 DUF2125 domain-containing protein [Pseudohalocynthiibacter aestuariivivens]MCK0103197.1 DUF2125 domain-containing protein [Pseudohalocynthiibacter sp. F2068]
MAQWKSISGLAATATLLTSTAVFADVTAAGVWNDYKTYMEGFGYTVQTGSEDMSGDTLTINDMNFSMDLGKDIDGTVSMSMGSMSLTEQGDGTVAITFPPNFDIAVRADGGNEDMNLVMSVAHSGMVIVASGDDSETAYDFSAPTMTMTMDGIEVEGEKIDVDLNAALTGYSGRYLVVDGAPTQISGDLTTDTMELSIRVKEPREGVDVDFDLAAAALAGTFAMSVPEVFDQENMAANLDAGMAFDFDYSLGAITFNLDGTGDGDSFAANGRVGGAEVAFEMNQDGMGLSELVKDIDIAISGSEIPFPELTLKAAEYGLNFLMPITKSDTPDDFEMGVRLVGIEVTDTLWNMIDPATVLPRDPATLVIDTAGKANWFFNIMNPEEAGMMDGGEIPGELHALTLNDLQVSVAGADLTGNGGFTFDNDDLQTFDGVPRPEGSIDLKLVGANGLLDKLVQMGLIPDDQAMGARMMMGLFAVPGDGEDTLNSKIEVNDQGHVLANGQRLK